MSNPSNFFNKMPVQPPVQVQQYEASFETLDPEYYAMLVEKINDGYFKEEQWHTIELNSTQPSKMLFHLKHYIDHRVGPEQLEVTLSDDYKRFMIYEFFQGIINTYDTPPHNYPHTEDQLRERWEQSRRPKTSFVSEPQTKQVPKNTQADLF